MYCYIIFPTVQYLINLHLFSGYFINNVIYFSGYVIQKQNPHYKQGFVLYYISFTIMVPVISFLLH